MTKHKIYGRITYVEVRPIRGIQGFFVQFKGKKGAIHMGHRKFLWLSTELAADLGFIEDPRSIPGNYKEIFMGKTLDVREIE